MKLIKLLFIAIVFFLSGCTHSNKDVSAVGVPIDFKDLKQVKASELISECDYIKLESSDASLFGAASQIEIYKNRIYILDRDKTNSLFVFSIEGKYLTKLEAKGNGPGEFMSPHLFCIDKRGYILILDRMMNRLLKYKIENLQFVENILLPSPAPLSFSVIENKDQYLYYYPLRKIDLFNNKQFVVADKAGKISQTLYEASSASNILHGNPTNCYSFKDGIRVYPYFTNKIYEFADDTLTCCYSLFWGKHKMPVNELFSDGRKSEDVMKEVLTGDKDWIRLLYVYETEDVLMVKYYIKQDFYISYWNKHTKNVINTKAKDIRDDLGIGGKFPLPVGVYNQKIIGLINPFEISQDKIIEGHLLTLLNGIYEESNPVLVFYKLK